MRNPFRAHLATAYSPAPNVVEADVNSSQHANTVYLDDGIYPAEHLPYPEHQGPLNDHRPPLSGAWVAGDESRELVFQPGMANGGYAFQQPFDPNPSIPGTVDLNIHHGPVSGMGFEQWTGEFTTLKSTPPSYHGPVGNTEPDYAQRAYMAYYQTALAEWSSASATEATLAAI